MRMFLKKIIHKTVPGKAKYRLNLFSIDEQTERFIQHNKRMWADWRIENSESEILVDFHSVSQTLIAYSYFLNVLASKHNACIKAFSRNGPYSKPALYKVYRSFNTSGYVVPILSQEQEIRKREISQKIKQNIKTKQDVFEICVMGVWIGIDIYESYLRYFNKPTVNLDDSRLFDLIDEAVGLFIFWTGYFEKKKIAAIVVSHDFTIHLNIICKIAYQNNIPVYLPNIRGINLSDSPHSIYSSRFQQYRTMFNNLSEEEQRRAILLAKKQIDRRFAGEVGVDMPYSTKSGFHQNYSENPVLRKSSKIKVLICTHCFYDNPHGYGGMLFVDFYEWLRYLGKMSKKTDYDWYLKTHPDPLPGTEDIIGEILEEFPGITFIPPDTSHHQLVREGIDFVLTVYGTVSHEYPALGVQVINAGFNPHIAYDFNWHAKTIEEYEYYLLNLDKLHKEINMQELYEFYYMHHYYVIADDLFLKSYRQFTRDLDRNQQISPATYEYFLDQLTPVKHHEIIENIKNFITSGKHNYFRYGPE